MTTATIRFGARLQRVNGRAILQLPQAASRKLASRGQVAMTVRSMDTRFRRFLNPTETSVIG